MESIFKEIEKNIWIMGYVYICADLRMVRTLVMNYNIWRIMDWNYGYEDFTYAT